jgi:hypothetical protein
MTEKNKKSATTRSVSKMALKKRLHPIVWRRRF